MAKGPASYARLGAAVSVAWFGAAALWFGPDPTDALVERALDRIGAPGAVVAFGMPGRMPELRAYGLADPAAGVPMTVTDRFKIASLSKPITAAAILELVRRRRLSLDTALVDILPAGAGDPRTAAITLRHLLQHSAGWDSAQAFDPFFLGRDDAAALIGADLEAAADCAPVADAMIGRPLQFDPGRRYAYSNLGYCWLGRVLARVRGDDYATAVHELVPETAPMSLDASSVTVTHALRPREEAFLVNRPEVIAAAGGWIASALDYFRFASRPVDPVVVDRPGYASGVQHYGLGWRVWNLEHGTVLTHYGAMPGAFAVVVKKIDGPVFVALFNGRPADEREAFLGLFGGVLDLPFWRE